MGSRNEYGRSVSTATAAWQCRSTIIDVERHTAKSQLLPGRAGPRMDQSLTELLTEQAFRFSRPQRQCQEAVVRGIACTEALMVNSWTQDLSIVSLSLSVIRVHAACQAHPHGPPHLTAIAAKHTAGVPKHYYEMPDRNDV